MHIFEGEGACESYCGQNGEEETVNGEGEKAKQEDREDKVVEREFLDILKGTLVLGGYDMLGLPK